MSIEGRVRDARGRVKAKMPLGFITGATGTIACHFTRKGKAVRGESFGQY